MNNLYSTKLVLFISTDPIMFRGLSAFEFYQSLFRVRTYGFTTLRSIPFLTLQMPRGFRGIKEAVNRRPSSSNPIENLHEL